MNKRLARVLAAVLATLLVLSAFPFVTFGEETVLDVGTAQEFIDRVVANSKNNSVVINITADFQLDDTTESDFAGTMNGNGHVITLGSQSALFNQVSGTVRDLGVIVAEDKPIVRYSENGEYCGVFANAVSGEIENCFTSGELNVTFSTNLGEGKKAHIGGFCGSLMEGGKITNSFSNVSINSTNAHYIGGFVGIVRKTDPEKSPNSTTIESCYSAGDIKATSGHVAGFANIDVDTIEQDSEKPVIGDTYTSCQIVKLNSRSSAIAYLNTSKPSGVDGLYDSQLSILRESVENQGLSTSALMHTTLLSDNFAVTTTAYPALKTFYDAKWSSKAYDVVEVSTAAAIFSDVNPDSRKEYGVDSPRADYLSWDTFVDRTNSRSLQWSIEGDAKLYDTVPGTNFDVIREGSSTSVSKTGGTAADILRARMVFESDSDTNTMVAESNGIKRVWHFSAYSSNPYFKDGDGSGDNVYQITNQFELNNVRLYSLIANASYRVMNDITLTNAFTPFDPIEDFVGYFEGNDKTISNVKLNKTQQGYVGLFANTRNGSTVQNMVLTGVEFLGSDATFVGGLIGKADATIVNNVLINVEIDGLTVGGLIGEMNGGTMSGCGVTGYVGNTATILGGLVGRVEKSSISDCYSTAVVLSDAQDAVAGGLVGIVEASAVSKSYSAALVDASQSHALVGQGSVDQTCFYDKQFYGQATDAQAVSKDVLLTNFASNTAWNVTESANYPQLVQFMSYDLSNLSTVPFVYQQYWHDKDADNLTTGWVSSALFNEPVVVSKLNESFTPQVYKVTKDNSFGFEAAQGQKRLVLKASSTNGVCVRYIAAKRDDRIALKYTVGGSVVVKDSNNKDVTLNAPRVYLDIEYRTDVNAEWTRFTVSSTTSDLTSFKRLYDLPKGCQVRVRAKTDDHVVVQSLTINEVALEKMTDGWYVSESVHNADVLIDLTVATYDRESLWGVFRETY